MKLKIKPASELKPVRPKEPTVAQIVKAYLNGPIDKAIKEAHSEGRNSINVEIPIDAYGEKEFYPMCIGLLGALGYKAGESHDGGGMYGTLSVSWPKKKY